MYVINGENVMFNTMIIGIIESIIILIFYIRSVEIKSYIPNVCAKIIVFIYLFISFYIFNIWYELKDIYTLIYVILDLIILHLISVESYSNILILSLIVRIFTIISIQTVYVDILMIFNIKPINVPSYEIIQLFSIIMSMIVLTALCLITLKLKKEVNNLITNYSKIFIAILFVIYITVIYLQDTIFSSIYDYRKMVTISYFMLAIIFLMIYLVYRIKLDNANILDISILERDMNKIKDEMRLFKKSNEDVSIIRHDMKNMLIFIDKYLAKGEIEKAREYILEITDSINKTKVMHITGVASIDCVLNSILSSTEKNNIEFVTNIDEHALNKIEDLDLAIILANALSNATENNGGDRKFVKLSIYSYKNDLIIVISNSVNKDVINENPNLNTNKNNLELHGFGIKSIKRIAKKYNGFADFYQEKNIFYCVVKLPINH